MYVSVAPFDYLSGSGSFVLTPSNSRACLNVTIVDDNVLELDEDFSATLTGTLPPGAAFDPTSTNVLINDNEGELYIILCTCKCLRKHEVELFLLACSWSNCDTE